MPRAPDQRIEEARKIYASGAKLIEVSQKLGIPGGTIRSWKNDIDGMMQRCKRINATLRKRRADSPEIKMRRGMEEPARREIRMQSGQESLKLFF